MITRRLLLASPVPLFVLPSLAIAQSRPVITMLGDSITAGLGLPAKDALPAQLQDALMGLGLAATVRAAGVSGDTTAGALARVDFSVQPDTTLCIVELGGNDYLQSVDPKQIRANLTAIARKLKARRIKVLILGGNLPGRQSGGYGKAFNAAFESAAKDTGVALLPDFLNGIFETRGLRQADGLHPNAKGVKVLAHRLAPAAAKLIRPGAV